MNPSRIGCRLRNTRNDWFRHSRSFRFRRLPPGHVPVSLSPSAFQAMGESTWCSTSGERRLTRDTASGTRKENESKKKTSPWQMPTVAPEYGYLQIKPLRSSQTEVPSQGCPGWPAHIGQQPQPSRMMDTSGGHVGSTSSHSHGYEQWLLICNDKWLRWTGMQFTPRRLLRCEGFHSIFSGILGKKQIGICCKLWKCRRKVFVGKAPQFPQLLTRTRRGKKDFSRKSDRTRS